MPGVIRTQWVQKMSDKFEAAFAKADADGSGSIGKFSNIGYLYFGHFRPSNLDDTGSTIFIQVPDLD